ncbi:MAG TPA: hypothetical protein VMV45_21420 [Casimicrobiaceae bacterium]|nr:hypothetical protein [Casimicrobiaceae bacterium]
MNPIETRIRIAALGCATALALACTVGLSALFEYGANDNAGATQMIAANAPHPTEVTISPAVIEVVATRESAGHNTVLSGWFRRHAG